MQAVINAIHIVMSIFILIGIGMYLTWRNRLNDQNASLISHLVVRVALPGTIISKLFGSFTAESMRECIAGLPAPVISIFLMVGIGWALGRILKIPAGRRGVFTCMMAFSNTVFIGVPVSTALFGEAVLPYTLMYYFANTVIFWTLGVTLLRKDGGVRSNADFKALPGFLIQKAKAWIRREPSPSHPGAEAAWSMIRKALPLPLVVFVLSVVLVLADVRLPSFALRATGYIGNMVTPLSLFFIGIVIMRMIRQKSFRWEKGYFSLVIGRFVVSTALMFLCAKAFSMPELMMNALIVQAGMPIMSQMPIVAGSLGADEEYAAGAVALTTLLSLIAIPVYMAIL